MKTIYFYTTLQQVFATEFCFNGNRPKRTLTHEKICFHTNLLGVFLSEAAMSSYFELFSSSVFSSVDCLTIEL